MPSCLDCGQENPDGFRFCGACGAPLTAAAPSRGEERKVVSVLFSDLVGFTARSDRADPEEVLATLRPYHALLRPRSSATAGTVEKFIGDAVMAVFGAPVAHEDDAERAVSAGLRITGRPRRAERAEPARGLAVRVAVNTGEAIVTLGARPEQGEGMVAGDVVNTAVAPADRSRRSAQSSSARTPVRATEKMIDYEPIDAGRAQGQGRADRRLARDAGQEPDHRRSAEPDQPVHRARARAGAAQAGVPADDPRVIGPVGDRYRRAGRR